MSAALQLNHNVLARRGEAFHRIALCSFDDTRLTQARAAEHLHAEVAS